MLRACACACFLALCGAVRVADGEDELIGVGAISRHGDRELLHKNGFDEVTAGTLTRDGFKRMEFLGGMLQQRYVDTLGLGKGGYSALHDSVRAVSSGFDRTVASGNAVMRGMFLIETDARLPPVFSEPDDNDIMLRFYGKCSALKRQMQASRVGRTWSDIEGTSLELRREAAAFTRLSSYSMDDVWNMHDRLLAIARGNATATVLLARTETLLNEIIDFDYNAAAIVPAAGRLVEDVNTFIRGLTNGADLRYKHWFGHYPTLVSFAQLIGLNMSGVPPFGATLVFEVRRSVAGLTSIRWSFVTITGGPPAFRAVETPLKLRTCADVACPLPSYLSATRGRELTEAGWCSACEDIGTPIDVCRRHFTSCVGGVPTTGGSGGGLDTIQTDTSSDRTNEEMRERGGFLLILLVCLCMSGMCLWYARDRRPANQPQQPPSQRAPPQQEMNAVGP